MELENMIVSHINQLNKDKHYMVSFTGGIKKQNKRTKWKRKNKQTNKQTLIYREHTAGSQRKGW